MGEQEKSETLSAIIAARQAKQQGRASTGSDIAQLEADLLADIESFDLEAAQREVSRADSRPPARGSFGNDLAFPEIRSEELEAPRWGQTVVARPPAGAAPAAAGAPAAGEGQGLLAKLRQQAEVRQRENETEQVQRTAANESIDQALRQLFFYLHELVQQLNVVKPAVPRSYPLLESYELAGLAWHEGFADYRAQAQSAGALVENVTLSYQLRGLGNLSMTREGPAVERMRTMLFDYGLQFSCKEFRNERRYVERAQFDVPAQLSVTARWRADFAKGCIILDTRNLERLGSVSYVLQPEVFNQTLFDEFGRFVLGEPNRFRDSIKRAPIR